MLLEEKSIEDLEQSKDYLGWRFGSAPNPNKERVERGLRLISRCRANHPSLVQAIHDAIMRGEGHKHQE